MKIRVEDAAEPDSSLEIKELTFSEIDRMLAVMYLSRADIYDRFDRGERCFAVLDGEHIRTYFWVQFSVRELDRLYLKVDLEPNQAWFYNAITVKSARGQGYYTNIIRHMAKKLKAEGFEEFFIDAEERNLASIRGMEKAGCKPVVRIQRRKLLSRVLYRVKVFDDGAWHGLLGIIKDFPRNQCVMEETANGSCDP